MMMWKLVGSQNGHIGIERSQVDDGKGVLKLSSAIPLRHASPFVSFVCASRLHIEVRSNSLTLLRILGGGGGPLTASSS